MELDDLDWTALERLRKLFLEGLPARASYWEATTDLASYDATFGERIGWKWDAVLRGLRSGVNSAWHPPPGMLFDFGCGSGIAGRRVMDAFGPAVFSTLGLYDKSRLAEDFAIEKAQRAFPEIDVLRIAPESALERGVPVTILISHVLNELSSQERRRLLSWVRRATAILWVEPGTHDCSRALIEIREMLLGDFQVLRPCTHRAVCGMFGPGRDRDWCHHFAPPPPGLSMDSFWSRFARQAGIDLRSTPYSHLVLTRHPVDPPAVPVNLERIVGRPRSYKGYVSMLSCGAGGLRELTLQRRDLPELSKLVESNGDAILAQWQLESGRIIAGEVLEPTIPSRSEEIGH